MTDRPDLDAWLDEWVDCIRSVDIDRARPLFAPDCLCFGTRGEVLRGLDDLVDHQWRPTWTTTRGFTFDADDSLDVEPDGATVAVRRWRSDGVRPDGTTFARTGRATIVLRHDPGAPHGLRAVHTHFSLSPESARPTAGTPGFGAGSGAVGGDALEDPVEAG